MRTYTLDSKVLLFTINYLGIEDQKLSRATARLQIIAHSPSEKGVDTHAYPWTTHPLDERVGIICPRD